MATFEDVKRLCADLRGVVESTSYGTPALKVGGVSFCRMWSDREHARDNVHDTDVLVVLCEEAEKASLIAAHPDALFSTEHYDGYGAMLVRMRDVAEPDLADHLEMAYRQKAPSRLLRVLEAEAE